MLTVVSIFKKMKFLRCDDNGRPLFELSEFVEESPSAFVYTNPSASESTIPASLCVMIPARGREPQQLLTFLRPRLVSQNGNETIIKAIMSGPSGELANLEDRYIRVTSRL